MAIVLELTPPPHIWKSANPVLFKAAGSSRLAAWWQVLFVCKQRVFGAKRFNRGPTLILPYFF